jgi:Flp pilus assembly pilin Flp
MSHLQLIFGRLALRSLELRRVTSRQQGQALIEYALIISLIALVAITALQTTGTNIKGILNRIAGEV